MLPHCCTCLCKPTGSMPASRFSTSAVQTSNTHGLQCPRTWQISRKWKCKMSIWSTPDTKRMGRARGPSIRGLFWFDALWSGWLVLREKIFLKSDPTERNGSVVSIHKPTRNVPQGILLKHLAVWGPKPSSRDSPPGANKQGSPKMGHKPTKLQGEMAYGKSVLIKWKWLSTDWWHTYHLQVTTKTIQDNSSTPSTPISHQQRPTHSMDERRGCHPQAPSAPCTCAWWLRIHRLDAAAGEGALPLRLLGIFW